MTNSMKFIVILFSCFISSSLLAQTSIDLNPFNNNKDKKKDTKKLYQKNHGAIIGIQKGAGTAFEMGYEMHWRKMSLFNPHISGATANMEYDFGNHLIAYKAGMWMKQGRINLTYGGNLVYFNNFNGMSKYGIGPSVGFRFAGFHFVNGFNMLAGDKDLKVNTLYTSLRYYFPVDNKFTWDRKTRKKKAEKQEEKERRKEERATEREGKTGIRKIFNL